jgi:hypothetical protein
MFPFKYYSHSLISQKTAYNYTIENINAAQYFLLFTP